MIRVSRMGVVMRFVILDVEASGLDGYPIEVGWCNERGALESHLICPAPGWTGWSKASERLHGITRETLEREGESYRTVAHTVWGSGSSGTKTAFRPAGGSRPDSDIVPSVRERR
jgi:hypothetical protein